MTVRRRRHGARWFFTQRATALAVAVTAWLGIVPGCNRGPVRPDVQFVEGIVTLDGEPVEGAMVGFVPGGAGIGAFGRTLADGRFVLTSSRGGLPGAGALAADYSVTVEKRVDQNMALADAAGDNGGVGTAEENEQRRRKIAEAVPNFTYIVPKAYRDPKTSGLSATVKKGHNTGEAFRFDLKGDFKGQ